MGTACVYNNGMYFCILVAEFEVPVACNGHFSALVAGYSFSVIGHTESNQHSWDDVTIQLVYTRSCTCIQICKMFIDSKLVLLVN